MSKIYIENRRYAARMFELSGSEIHISYRERVGHPPTVVSLANLRAGPKRFDRLINPAPLKRAGIYLGVVAVLALIVFRSGWLSPTWTAVVFGLLSIPGIKMMIYFWIPFSVYRYVTTNGQIAFDITYTEKTARELQDFIATIDSAIDKAKGAQTSPP